MAMSVEDIKLSSWMGESYVYIKELRLDELSLPSAHNSGMDRKARSVSSYTTCQNDSFKFQMENGIRVMDTRLAYYWGAKGELGDKFSHVHNLPSGHTLNDQLEAVKAFLSVNPDEYVIIDIHDLSPAHDTPIPYADLAAYIEKELKGRLLPYEASTMSLEQLKKNYPGQTVVVAAGGDLYLNASLMWPKIQHKWIGQPIVTAYQLGGYIESVMQSPPSGDLWSLSATGYAALGPTYIESDIDDWFASRGEYQMKSNIINVDWFDRTRLVLNCIDTNIAKGARK